MVDPGLRGSGCAAFNGSELVLAAYVKNPVAKGDDAHAIWKMVREILCWSSDVLGEEADEIVCERMQVYGPEHSKGDPNDLITLSLIAGALRPTWLYLPRTWKGQLPKDTMGARIISRLTADEKTRIVDAGAKTHNAIDAVGIGLYHVGRLSPRRVIAR